MFEKMLLALKSTTGMEGVTAEQLASGDVKLTPEAIKQMTIELGGQAGALKGLSNVEDQMIIFQAGIDRLTEIEERKSEVEAIKLKLAETEGALAEKRSGWEKTIRKQEGIPTKETTKEDRKDERTRIQASQQSELIEQRNTDAPAKNFESAGFDNLEGFGLEQFEPQ